MSAEPKPVLLFGEAPIVAEFARLLEKKSRDFLILNSTDEFGDDLSAEELIAEALEQSFGPDQAMEAEDDDVNEYYDEFAENVVMSISDLSDKTQIEFIIDCSIKSQQHKVLVLQELAEFFPSALIISSTLVCTATDINSMLPLASQVVGAPLIPGFSEATTLEIAPSLRTREISHQRARSFFESLGFAVEIVEDRIALVFPRMIAMLINEAAFAVMEKVATAQDIDTAMKLGVNYPKGLLEWADRIGADVIVAILDALFQEYHEPRYKCCALLRQHVRSGWLGKTTGRGFYNYLPMN